MCCSGRLESQESRRCSSYLKLGDEGEPLVQMRYEGLLLEYSLLHWEADFFSTRSSADWMRPITLWREIYFTQSSPIYKLISFKNSLQVNHHSGEKKCHKMLLFSYGQRITVHINGPEKSCSENTFLHLFKPMFGGSDGRESACNAGDSALIPGLGRSPGEGMATPSNILAWRIPWTGPNGLQSMGSQRVRHD